MRAAENSLIFYFVVAITSKKPSRFCEGLIFLVAGTGLEPVTFGL